MKREKSCIENYKTFSNFNVQRHLLSPVIRPKKDDDSILTSPMNLSKFKYDKNDDNEKSCLSEEELFKAKLNRREKLNLLNKDIKENSHIYTPEMNCKNSKFVNKRYCSEDSKGSPIILRDDSPIIEKLTDMNLEEKFNSSIFQYLEKNYYNKSGGFFDEEVEFDTTN